MFHGSLVLGRRPACLGELAEMLDQLLDSVATVLDDLQRHWLQRCGRFAGCSSPNARHGAIEVVRRLLAERPAKCLLRKQRIVFKSLLRDAAQPTEVKIGRLRCCWHSKLEVEL